MYKGIVQLVIGLMMIVTLLVGYLPIPEYLVELTCISNMLGGVLLTIDGILSICGKKNLSSNLYRAVCVCILTVSIIGLVEIYVYKVEKVCPLNFFSGQKKSTC